MRFTTAYKNSRKHETSLALVPVPTSSFRPHTATDFDIFFRPDEEREPILFRQKNVPITVDVLQNLWQHDHDVVYIRSTDARAYRAYIEKNLSNLLSDKTLPMGAKVDVIYACSTNLMNDVMLEPRARNAIQRARQLVNSTVEFMRSDEKPFQHLISVMSRDYYTYTHSVHVFMFSMALAQRANFDDPDLLRVFGEGALLHDVGKSRVDTSILNCKGRLSTEQWHVMKKHPAWGCELLAERGGIEPLALDLILHHHEKLDGRGYPNGLKGDEVSPLVRITTIADIFDALTTRRPYKEAMPPEEALDLMRSRMLGEIDPDLFATFEQMILAEEVTKQYEALEA
jgi:HD-GYP domain-containing protein (c-di-GMP phosphodiesterase class II)